MLNSMYPATVCSIFSSVDANSSKVGLSSGDGRQHLHMTEYLWAGMASRHACMNMSAFVYNSYIIHYPIQTIGFFQIALLYHGHWYYLYHAMATGTIDGMSKSVYSHASKYVHAA